jgi:hypothetical protein
MEILGTIPLQNTEIKKKFRFYRMVKKGFTPLKAPTVTVTKKVDIIPAPKA